MNQSPALDQLTAAPSLDGETMDRFSTLEDAVTAADYEIDQMGRGTAMSALPGAPWRRGREEALRAAAWTRVVRPAAR